MKMKLMSLALGTVVASIAFTACETAPTGTNTNKVVVNSNTAVVTNTNTNVTVVNTNSTVEMGNKTVWNSNITQTEFEKDKAKWESEAKTAGAKIGTGASDMWIWTKAKSTLATVNDLRDSTVNVDVDNSVITLKGTVATADHKKKAEDAVKVLDGVKSVKNELQVKANDSMTNQMVNGTAANTANTNAKK